MRQPDILSAIVKAAWLTRILPAGIQQRLFLLIILVLLPQGLFLAWIYNERYQARSSQAMKTELEVAHGVAMAFSGYVDNIWRLNHALGEAIQMFSPPVLPKAAALLNTTATQYASIRNLSWVSPEGIILASSQPDLVGLDISQRSYFKKIAAGAHWSINDLTSHGIKATRPTLVIATGRRTNGGILDGLVVAGIEPERLGELTLTQNRPSEGAYAIYDSQGTVVYHSIYQNLSWADRIKWLQDDKILQQALRTKRPQVDVAVAVFRQHKWVSARVVIPETGWVVGAGTPHKVVFAPIRQTLVREVTASIFVMVLAFLFAYMVARTIALPLQRLQHATKDIREAGSGPDDPLAPLEVGQLREVIVEMTANLRAGEKRFRQALESMPDLIVIYDSGLRIRYVNPSTCRATKLSASELIDRPSRELWPDVYMLWHPVLEKCLLTATVEIMEMEVPTPHGTRNFAVTFVPLLEEGGTVKEVMSIGHDFSLRKQAEDNLKKTMEELIRSNRELEQFAYVASHDLQEPLRMVASYVQLLSKKYQGSLDEKADMYIDYAIEGARRMQSLIEDLLAYGRINRPIDFSPVDMNEALAEAIASMATSINEAEGRIEHEPLPVISGDRVQLHTLLQNLINNAIKYRRHDIPPVINVSSRQVAEEWIFAVRDNGIGIEPEYFERIFHIFQRLHTRDEHPGTGIGLASSKKIVELHGGRIWVESTPGAGSTFYFTIPRYQQPISPQGK